MTLRPVLFRWQQLDVHADGGEVRRIDAMVPHPRFHNLCGRQFDRNEDYALGPVEGVPSRSRGGFFAAIHEAWNNLPAEDERYPSSEHLRKVALVKAGWATHAQYVLDTAKDAKSMAVGLRKSDGYSIITVSGCSINVWTAKSIAAGAISGEEWRVVKTKALDWVATLARTTRPELEAHVADGGAR